jgi:hypothetical protein
MQNLTGKSDSGDMAAALLAIQHILVTKGICSFAELSAANRRSQSLVKAIGEAATGAQSSASLIQHIKEVTEFIGGSDAMNGLSDVLSKIGDISSKEK